MQLSITTATSLVIVFWLSWCHTLGLVNGQFLTSAVSFSSQTIKQALDINVTFTTMRAFYPEEAIIVCMPRFTRRIALQGSVYTVSPLFDIPMGELVMSPSIHWNGSWTEGVYLVPDDIAQESSFRNSSQTPFADGYFTFRTTPNDYLLPAGSSFTLTVYQVNRISAYCGFPGSVEYSRASVAYRNFETVRLQIQTNLSTTLYSNLTGTPDFSPRIIDVYSGFGTGCKMWNKCHGHGACDHCLQKCHCDQGFGMWNDTVTKGRNVDPSCLQMTCPVGKAIVDIPTSSTKAHAPAECSDRGLCDRKTGLCTCFAPFTGGACERLRCPNDCSGHGQCLSMKELAIVWSERTPTYKSEYGQEKYDTEAWDYDVMYGCFCDSSWAVGYESGEKQLGEYFGPDCSLRRCPSGNNPYSNKIETDCFRKTQTVDGMVVQFGGREVGRLGNVCHIDCSNRGICDYNTGTCKCFEGSWGDDCSQLANAGNSRADYSNFYLYNDTVISAN